jgi:hypothetical protein
MFILQCAPSVREPAFKRWTILDGTRGADEVGQCDDPAFGAHHSLHTLRGV